MEVGVLIFLLLGLNQVSAAPPDVFDDYFEQDVKAVHLPMRGVIKACLPENRWTNLLAKFEAANTACEVGNENNRFDWATLAELNKGGDGDGNGVQFNLEFAEGCIYRQLEWTDGDKLKAANVKEDFKGLPSTIWNRLEADLKECYSWNGEFGTRKKRDVEEVGEEVDEVEDEVGQAYAGNLLNWAKELLLPRSRRSAESGLTRRKRAAAKGGQSKGKGKGKGKTGEKQRKGKKKGKKTKKKSKNKRNSGKKGGGKRNSKSKNGQKSGGSGLAEGVYNKLWCADLAVEKALRRCAMQKIQGLL